MIFWSLWLLAVVQRLSELIYSRQNQNKLAKKGFALQESPSAYSEMVIMHIMWFICMAAERLFYASQVSGWLIFASASGFLIAQLIRIWAIASLGQHWNTCVMAPAEMTTENTFVAKGPYRYIRHPNYLAVIIEIFSLPLTGGAFITSFLFTVWNALVLKKRLEVEEKFLNSRPGYSELFRDKKRFVPGVF